MFLVNGTSSVWHESVFLPFQIQLCPSSDFAVTQLHGILRLGFNSRSVDSKESHLFCACFNDNNFFFTIWIYQSMFFVENVFEKLLCELFARRWNNFPTSHCKIGIRLFARVPLQEIVGIGTLNLF